VARYLPQDLGIEGDFQELAIKFFPPGIALKKPKVTVRERNIANLPTGSEITAEEIHFNFRPLQMFSGTIRIHEVLVVQGEVKLVLNQSPSQKKNAKKTRLPFTWDDLFKFQADAVAVKDTRFDLGFTDSPMKLQFVADSLRLEQETRGKSPGYGISTELHEIHGTFPRQLTRDITLPAEIERLRANAHLDAAGLQLESLVLLAQGIAVDASGLLKGNLLSPKDLLIDASVNASADIPLALQLLNRKNDPVSGTVSFSGKVRANLMRFAETARAEGVLNAKDSSSRSGAPTRFAPKRRGARMSSR